MTERVVLAYSGGLDTSVAVPWLRESHGYDVVALTADVGGGADLAAIGARGLAGGASVAIGVDARAAFVSEYVWPALQAGAVYQGVYPLATALARPLIARLLVEAAHETGATLVAHGCTGKGNDQVRFDVAIGALDPSLTVIAPMRKGMGMNRDEELAYARAHGIPLEPGTGAVSPYSIDVNLWGRSIEAGVLEDPWAPAPADAFAWTADPAEAPRGGVEVAIGFEQGVPVSLDGEGLDGVALIERLNALGGAHGVGRIDHVEDRLIGIKSREIYEAPAAVILHAAHAALEQMVLSRDLLAFKRGVADRLAQLTYDGVWFGELAVALRRFVASTQDHVNGTVRVRLLGGSVAVIGRSSPDTLYRHDLATYGADDSFDQAAAVGFIALWGLPVRVQSAIHGSAVAPGSLLDALGAVRLAGDEDQTDGDAAAPAAAAGSRR